MSKTQSNIYYEFFTKDITFINTTNA